MIKSTTHRPRRRSYNMDLNFLLDQSAYNLSVVERQIKKLEQERAKLRLEAVELLRQAEPDNLPHRFDGMTLSLVETRTWAYRSGAVTATSKEVERLEGLLKGAKANLAGAKAAAQAAGGSRAKVIEVAYSVRLNGVKHPTD